MQASEDQLPPCGLVVLGAAPEGPPLAVAPALAWWGHPCWGQPVAGRQKPVGAMHFRRKDCLGRVSGAGRTMLGTCVLCGYPPASSLTWKVNTSAAPGTALSALPAFG